MTPLCDTLERSSIRRMEAHRNAWLMLTVVTVAAGSIFLSQVVSAHGDILDRPGIIEVLGFFAVAILCFALAVRQVRMPFLQGAESALLYRELVKQHGYIHNATNPTQQDMDAVASVIRKAIHKYGPQFSQQFESDVKRGGEGTPDVHMEFMRQGIAEILKHLSAGAAS